MNNQLYTLSNDRLIIGEGIDSAKRTQRAFASMGISLETLADGDRVVRSPIDGRTIASIAFDSPKDQSEKVSEAEAAFRAWRTVPAPRRGELVRLFGHELRANKEALAVLVTVESGKIYTEALGEVQEMIDICDFAVGLSRQLYGLTMPSERPDHKLSEYWHPIGVIGVISAFNFPAAVWAWNTALALVCGDAVVWKPSEKTPLTAIACSTLLQNTLDKFDEAPIGLHQLLLGDQRAGKDLVRDQRIPVISATGSTAMGRKVAPVVAERFGRCILELGGNNAMIVTPSADLHMAAEAILFSAVGTAGQRCTSLRRVIAHESIIDELTERLLALYTDLPIGDPFNEDTLIGPIIDGATFERFQVKISELKAQSWSVEGGERINIPGADSGFYVNPAIVRVDPNHPNLQHELFAPLLYVMPYSSFGEAIRLHNDVPQGLSSSIFSNDIRESETFLSSVGSDCGIANVNAGPSGAEIGSAFGGEKETGGGRESGSDAWKNYMRRMTTTVNYSHELPLAQGVDFSRESSRRIRQ